MSVTVGVHTGRIAFRLRPNFRLRAAFDVRPKYLTRLHRADGYDYPRKSTDGHTSELTARSCEVRVLQAPRPRFLCRGGSLAVPTRDGILMASHSLRKRATTASSETTYDLFIRYDDGAGFSKMIARAPGVSDEVLEFKYPALVALNTFFDPMGTAGIELMNVEESHKNGTGPIFDDSVVYAVGTIVMANGTGRFDTSHQRYVTESAMLRFHAGLGKALKHFGLDHAIIDLTVSVNTERFKALADRLVHFYSGDHYFRYNGDEVRGHVARVLVGPQAIAAAFYIQNNPPEQLRALLEENPLTESTILTLDGGNFNINYSVLIPHPTLPDMLLPVTLGSVDVGTHNIRERAEEEITKLAGTRPPLRVVDNAINPRHASYGTVPNPRGGKINISKRLAEIRRAVWEDGFSQIRAKTSGAGPQYVFVVGGFGIVAADEIDATEIGTLPGGAPLTFKDLPGFYNAESEWAVVRGLDSMGTADVEMSQR